MPVSNYRRLKVLALLVPICMIAATASSAQQTFHISLNTALLTASSNGPFSLDFQFSDGSGVGDNNNTVVLSGFQFGAGSPLGNPTLLGAASGNLGSSIMLTDAIFFTEFYQQFLPGNTLEFDVNTTVETDSGPVPDEFSFAILDGNLNELPTEGPANAFLLMDLNSGVPQIRTFASS